MSEETKHTPGPWRFDESNFGINSDPGWGIVGPSGESLGVTVHWDNHCEAGANARLIAAAPDLLAACKAALARPGLEGWQREQITAAIARAEAEGRDR